MVNNSIKKGYKRTQIGVLPMDWSVIKLGDYVTITSGESPSRFKMQDEGLPYFKVEQLNNSTKYQEETPYHIKDSRRVRAGSILFPKRGASIFLNKIRLLKKDSYFDTNLMALTIDEELDSGFLFYAINYFGLDKVADATSVPQINNKHINPLELAVPSEKAEQTIISSVLSDVDDLITLLNLAIAKKRNIKTATMQELLTGTKRLSGFKRRWEKTQLGDLLAYEQPTQYLVRGTEYNDIYETPVLTAGKTFVLGYTDETTGIFTDVPVIIFDDFTTANKYVTFPFKAKSSAMKMLRPRNKEINLRFVFEKMQLIDFKLGDHKRYWISEYQNLELDMPQPDEQAAIATVLSDMDDEIGGLEAMLKKTRELKQGMMQKLLTGIIRLI